MERAFSHTPTQQTWNHYGSEHPAVKSWSWDVVHWFCACETCLICVRLWWGIVGHYGTLVCMGWCCQEFALHFNLSWSSKGCWSREWRSCSFQELRSLSMNSVSGGGWWRVGSALVKMSEDLNPWVTNQCYYDLYDTEILKLRNILFLHLICILLKSWSLFRLLISLFQVSWWQTLFFQLLRLTPWNLYWLLFSHNSYLSIRDPAVSVCFSPHQCYHPGGSCQFLLLRLLQLSAH